MTRTANVLPRIGRLQPLPAREAVRAAFLRHVIGGGRLSRGRGFEELVLAATPDAVLAGVQALAGAFPGGVLARRRGRGHHRRVLRAVAAVGRQRRGRRGRARGRLADGRGRPRDAVVGARAWRGGRGGGPAPGCCAGPLDPAAVRALADDPGALADDDASQARDTDLALVAAVAAARRHARPAVPGAQPRPLRDVELLVGSGGVLRHGDGARADRVLGAVLGDHAGMWHVPDAARAAVDVSYVLCALGLLALAG